MKNVIIAGGTGYIGKHLEAHLSSAGYNVQILTRKPTELNHIYWNPTQKEIDLLQLRDVQVLINLTGESVGSGRWTKERKEKLYASRIGTTQFLYTFVDSMPRLEHYITASGATCFGFKSKGVGYVESDTYGTDFLSQLTKDWENAADTFQSHVSVTKVRTGIVVGNDAGALNAMIKPIKSGYGAIVASGKQIMPWIHIDDVVGIYQFLINTKKEGTFHAVAQNNTNEEFMKTIADLLGRKLMLPRIPIFIMKALYGQMAEIIVYGVPVTGQKIMNEGYSFNYNNLKKALLFLKK